MAQDFSAIFIRKEQRTIDVWSFYFDRTTIKDENNNPITDWNFLPGQYIRMFLEIPNPDARGTTRMFSIASSPLNTTEFMFTTKIGKSSFKQTLSSIIPGTLAKFFGPAGVFVLDESNLSPKVLLAGGIGITPFHSMILFAAEKKIKTPITFIASFSTKEEVLFYDDLTNAAKQNPNIKIIYTITHPEGDLRGFETGRISKEMVGKYCTDISNTMFYVVGPEAMLNAMLDLVNEMGIPPEQVKKEKFVGY